MSQRQTDVLLSKELVNGDRAVVATAGTSEDAGTITPAKSSAATVDNASLEAAARVDIAHVLELRQSKRLTLGEKIRLHSTVLRVPQSCHCNYRYKRRQSRSTTCDIIISAAAVMPSTSISTSRRSYKVFSAWRVCCMHLTMSASATSQSSAFS